MQSNPCALDFPAASDGNNSAARIPMMAMTTNNSISVKPRGQSPHWSDRKTELGLCSHMMSELYSAQGAVQSGRFHRINFLACRRNQFWQRSGKELAPL